MVTWWSDVTISRRKPLPASPGRKGRGSTTEKQRCLASVLDRASVARCLTTPLRTAVARLTPLRIITGQRLQAWVFRALLRQRAKRSVVGCASAPQSSAQCDTEAQRSTNERWIEAAKRQTDHSRPMHVLAGRSLCRSKPRPAQLTQVHVRCLVCGWPRLAGWLAGCGKLALCLRPACLLSTSSLTVHGTTGIVGWMVDSGAAQEGLSDRPTAVSDSPAPSQS